MALIVVAEDDGGTRKLISVVLKNAGHEVLDADNGETAWQWVQMHRPALLISDINMPGMNGFDLLRNLREHPTLNQTPVVLLTSLQERRDMRLGMVLGADDYLTKPLRPKELSETVQAQFNRQRVRASMRDMQVQDALSEALENQAWDLQEQYEQRLARELSEQWPGDQRDQVSLHYPQATVLYADIRHYAEWLKVLSATELGLLLKRFYESCGDTVHLFGAATMQFIGEGVLAIFADEQQTSASAASHNLRAVKAALGLRNAAASVERSARSRFADRQLPPFEIGVALQCGPVAMMRLDGLLGGNTQRIPVGETIVDAMAMQRHVPLSQGAITVSAPVYRSIMGSVKPVARYLLPLPHRQQPIDVCVVEPLPA